MSNKHAHPGADERSRGWLDVLADALRPVNLILLGFVIGVGLCKFCEPFWRWIA